METIRTNRILAAYPDNFIDWDKVNLYAKEMNDQDTNQGVIDFPPISGFYDVVNSNDLGNYFNYANYDNHELITKKHLGLEVFRVTDGNHRTCAAQLANIFSLETQKDLSGFVNY